MVLPPDVYEMIAVLTLPVMAMTLYCLTRLGRSPIGKAHARRIGGESGIEREDRLLELEDRVDRLQAEVVETQECLDFAERLLGQVDNRGSRLSPPAWSDPPEAGMATPV